MRDGRVDDAVRLLSDAFRVNRELDDTYRLPFIVCRFAGAVAAKGMAGTAARMLSCGQSLLDELSSSEDWMERTNEETLLSIRAQLDEAAFAEAWEQGGKLTAEQAVTLALDSLGEDAAGAKAGSRSRVV